MNFGEQCLDGRIDFLKLLIPGFILGYKFGLRLHDGCHRAQLAAAVLHGFVFAAGNHSQHSAAHAGALFGYGNFQFRVQHIGKDPFPQRALGSAAADFAGVDGDAQRISQMTWMFFLKVYDAKEQLWEINDENYYAI